MTLRTKKKKHICVSHSYLSWMLTVAGISAPCGDSGNQAPSILWLCHPLGSCHLRGWGPSWLERAHREDPASLSRLSPKEVCITFYELEHSHMTPLNSKGDWHLRSSYVPREKGMNLNAQLAVSAPGNDLWWPVMLWSLQISHLSSWRTRNNWTTLQSSSS